MWSQSGVGKGSRVLPQMGQNPNDTIGDAHAVLPKKVLSLSKKKEKLNSHPLLTFNDTIRDAHAILPK
jgi:hypothetical protein